MPKPLVIVESPAKARTIAGFLGRDFVVESSVGHIRDLPRSAADIPAGYKGEPWARLGVDTDNGFKPLYVVPSEKRNVITDLKRALRDATEVYLATDEDREGEAIAWHLAEVLSPNVPVKRMVFHEITQTAIRRAIDEPRELDRRLVDAQETRRILDRLYGYEVSPVLWKKVMPKLSAGRVQSVATRLVVERERDRMTFRKAAWWDIEGTFAVTAEPDEPTAPRSFSAVLVAVDGSRLATGRDFDPSGALSRDDVILLDEPNARTLATDLESADFAVRSVERRPYRRQPYAPFMTSTLQQEAARKLRFSAARTMAIAQRLYENGYITYMRTDSITLSETAVDAARAAVRQLYGEDYLPARPRTYAGKVRNAQEAHEAIRPAGDRFRTTDEVSGALGDDERRLYDLVWKRTVASQMADAVGESVTVRVGALSAGGRDAEFAATGKVITFPGFLRAYVEGSDDPEAELEDRERHLPPVAEGDGLDVEALEPGGHETQPPARYTEASLVRRLEELGVGRPSTYASILSTIQDRGYVWRRGSALVPSFTAFAVVTLLERHFPELVDYAFTARMEDDLDEIAAGDEEMIPWLARFYFGNGHPGLKRLVSDHLGEIDARDVNSIPIGEDDDGTTLVVRVGRYGPYVQRGEDTAGVPEDLPPDELTVARALELIEAPSQDRVLGTDPETGLSVLARAGRYGPYVQLGEVDGDAKEKPKTSSLLSGMALETVTLDDALQLLSLPRVVGTDPADGEEVLAYHGRYGPYIKKGSDTRSLEHEDQLFTLTLDQALELLAQPKRRRGQRGAAALRELGEDPATEKPVVLKSGRFGPYVTDGETNASLRTGDDPDEITLERAAELLADRRSRGPAKGRGGRKGRGSATKTAKAKSKSKRATKATKGAKKAAKKAEGKGSDRGRRAG